MPEKHYAHTVQDAGLSPGWSAMEPLLYLLPYGPSVSVALWPPHGAGVVTVTSCPPSLTLGGDYKRGALGMC